MSNPHEQLQKKKNPGIRWMPRFVLQILAIDDRLVQVFIAMSSVTLFVVLRLLRNQSVAGEQQS